MHIPGDGLVLDLSKAKGKLANTNFVNNAPTEVVTKETERAASLEDQTTKLQEQLEKLENLN